MVVAGTFDGTGARLLATPLRGFLKGSALLRSSHNLLMDPNVTAPVSAVMPTSDQALDVVIATDVTYYGPGVIGGTMPARRMRVSGALAPSLRVRVNAQMMRMLLIGYLQGIRSERRLCDEVHLNLAYRWFCRLGLDGSAPDPSTVSKNRHGRFRDGDVHRLLFEEVVRACAAAGLVAGRDTAIDASTIEADAGCERKFTGAASADTWGEQERQARPVREYLAALDAALPAAPDEREPAPPKYTSSTDPQAAWSIKHGPGRFSYATNYLIDSETSVILDVEATAARLGTEVAATRTFITRAADRFGVHPERLAADKAYCSAGCSSAASSRMCRCSTARR